MINTELFKTVKYKFKILEITKEIPNDKIEDFKDWIINKGIELGLGKQYEYYVLTENDVIGVMFLVQLIK